MKEPYDWPTYIQTLYFQDSSVEMNLQVSKSFCYLLQFIWYSDIYLSYS